MKKVNINKQRELQIIIILLALVGIVSFVGYLYWSNFMEPNWTTTNTNALGEKALDHKGGRLQSTAEDRARAEAHEMGQQRDCVEKGLEDYWAFGNFWKCPSIETLNE